MPRRVTSTAEVTGRVAVRRGLLSVWPSEARPDVPHARTGRARSAGSQGVMQSSSAGEDPNRDGCSDGRDREGDTSRDSCNEGEATALASKRTSFTSGGPGIGLGARRSWRDEGRPGERGRAIRAAAGQVRSGATPYGEPYGEKADR